jgi:hypothetical protein
MKAKTYKSTNNFTAPQSLSKFGIVVAIENKTKYLGLEEFNFCPIIRNFKFKSKNMAFVPCFSTTNRNPIDKLDLFYLDAPGVIIHYATLYGVSQVQESDIQAIRNALIQAKLPDFVKNSQDFQVNYSVVFNSALKIWNNCFDSNIISGKGTSERFILNTFYEKIEFHNPKNIVYWSNLQRARLLYP